MFTLGQHGGPGGPGGAGRMAACMNLGAVKVSLPRAHDRPQEGATKMQKGCAARSA